MQVVQLFGCCSLLWKRIMFKFFKGLAKGHKIALFSAQVSGALFDLGVNSKELVQKDFNDNCRNSYGKSNPYETAARIFIMNAQSLPRHTYTVPLELDDFLIRGSKVIGIWHKERRISDQIAEPMIKLLEDSSKETVPKKSVVTASSDEVTATVESIDEFFLVNKFICEDIVRPEAVSLGRDAEKTRYSIINDGLTPDDLALILITNVINNHITSGNYHTYRGVLNQVGTDLKKVWGIAVNKLHNSGYYTEAQAEDDIRYLDEQIKKVG